MIYRHSANLFIKIIYLILNETVWVGDIIIIITQMRK